MCTRVYPGVHSEYWAPIRSCKCLPVRKTLAFPSVYQRDLPIWHSEYWTPLRCCKCLLVRKTLAFLSIYWRYSSGGCPLLWGFLKELWVRAKIPSLEPSPWIVRQICINFIRFIICNCELVKLCFINKVRKEHVQIINTRGKQSVINPVNKISGVYNIHSRLTSVHWQFFSIPPPPLLPPTTPTIPLLTWGGDLGLGQDSELGALPSDSMTNTHKPYSIYYMQVWTCVKSFFYGIVKYL